MRSVYPDVPRLSAVRPGRRLRAAGVGSCVLLVGGALAALAGGEAAPSPEPQQAPGQPTQPTPAEPWRDPRLRALSHQTEKLSEAIFQLIEDIDLVDLRVGATRLSVNTGRQVYDNHDVLGTYTVVDRLRARLGRGLWAWDHPLGPVTARFAIGAAGEIEITDIRQVRPGGDHMEAMSERIARMRAAIEASGSADGAGARSAPGADAAMALQPEAFDGLGSARYGRLWNLVAVPARLPLGSALLSDMEPGEVISYSASGTLTAGPSLSDDLGLPGLDRRLGLSLTAQVLINGRFRVAVLREDARHAQVKITRQAEWGGSLTFASSSDDVITGVTLVNSDLVHGRTVLVPWGFDVSQTWGRTLDLVYRFDLGTTDGLVAYEHAVRGRLDLADRFAGGSRWRESPLDGPVARVGERHTVFDRYRVGTRVRYGIVYRHWHEADLTTADVSYRLRDGDHRLFRAAVDAGSLWRFVWGDREARSQRWRINVDLDRHPHDPGDRFSLIVESEVVDTDTTGEEMSQYADQLERAVGRRIAVPRLPRFVPDIGWRCRAPPTGHDRRRTMEGAFVPVPANYGRSTFFYQLVLGQDQVERFIATEPARMWPALERAFEVPPGTWSTRSARMAWRAGNLPERLSNFPLYLLNIHLREGSMLQYAEEMEWHWQRARAAGDVRERVRSFGRMVANRRYQEEAVRLLRVVLGNEPVTYVIEARNWTFGRLRAEETAAAPIEPLPERLERRIDIDRRTRGEIDPEAGIGDFSVRTRDGRSFAVELTLPTGAPPLALWLRMVETRPWRMPRAVAEAVALAGALRLQPGRNEIAIEGGPDPVGALFQDLDGDSRYVLQISATRDGRVWGPLAEAEFTVPFQPTASPPQPNTAPQEPPAAAPQPPAAPPQPPAAHEQPAASPAPAPKRAPAWPESDRRRRR